MKFCFSKPFAGFAIAILLSFLSISTVQAKPTIEWEPENLELRQAGGTVKTYTLQANFNKATTDVVARVVPALEEWISVNPISFGDTRVGDTIELELIVSIPSGETAANHGGIVQLRGGKNQKSLAKPLHVNLTIIPQTDDGLPPDPGEAGKESLLGIDSDLDGVRDDVQRYIMRTYPDQPEVRKALIEIAKVSQLILRPDLEEADVIDLAQDLTNDIQCLYYYSPTNASQLQNLLRAEIFNTDDRVRHYFRNYDEKLIGSAIPLSSLPLSEHFKLCKFNQE